MTTNHESSWSKLFQNEAGNGDLADLSKQKPDAVIAALQQMSNTDSVTGFTLCVVELAGSSNDLIRMWAAESLERSIEPTEDEIPALIELLQTNEEGEVRYWAATMLGRLGTAAAEAGQALSDCLERSLHLPARERSAWALCQIGDAAIVAKDTLNKAAHDAPPRLRRIAAEALKIIGEAA